MEEVDENDRWKKIDESLDEDDDVVDDQDEDEFEVVEEDGEIRCICSYNLDDGYTIQCEKCLVWQHMTCLGYDESSVPDMYVCEKCEPRYIDEE
ncbi:hypothetical protein HK096_002799, partial [Nowakowskiella sp. JEL0078]